MGFPGGSVVKNPPASVGDACSISGPWRSPGVGNGNPLQYSLLGSPMDSVLGGSDGKEFPCNVGDLGSIPGMGRTPEEENGYPLQYSGLENSMDCIVHGVTKSLIRLSY